ncbi:DUF732 domain-containing protein [Mycobacterium talmoniae]|uniref:DUF732 domain-containing protein n=1 Tax=Mycobacterium talmoniae TaxID=1858794 RepID=A0A1S1NJ04_9MYCO|nr:MULTISPECIES: DUF732 domain-containing protein [Mycobacterium]OHV06027.1 hypothetical protein BKN37_03475 [Mycobacterium talmoniae]PQM44696.1 hypothetical protein C1Y40_05145 [Mycobacterium talmoniae]
MKKCVCAVGAVLAVVVGPPAVATAGTDDDAFLQSLAGQGITGDPNQLVAAGHTACDDLSGVAVGEPGFARLAALRAVADALQLPLEPQADFVVRAAETAYCPQYGGL